MVGRSRCFSCGKNLSWFELIPILSFIIQRGRCSPPAGGCGSKISWQYPIVELITALLAAVLNFQWFYFAAFCALLLVAVYDFRHKIIDKHFLYIFAGFAIANLIYRNIEISKYLYDFLHAAVIFAFFYLLWRVSSGKWMGRGDSDLAFFLALFLGHPLSLFMVLFSFWFGAIVGILLLLKKSGRFTIKSEVPFGPFLAFGAFVSWYFKDFLLMIYEFLYF